MIDWWMVGANSLWILGLAILLAAFSYHDWLARETRQRRRELFKQSSWRLPWASGMLLTCTGLGLAQAERRWEKGLWLVLAVSFAWELARLSAAAWREARSARVRRILKRPETS